MRNRDLRPAAKANPTIQQAFERFQKYNRLKNLSQGSLDFYAAKGRRFFRFLGDTEQPIHTITEETVEDYIFYMKDQQLHDTTINTNLRMVRAFLYWCMEKGYLEKYPIRLVRADDPIKEPYTTDELQKLLKEPDCKTCSFAEYRNTVGIDKEVEVNRKENLRDHRLYWIGRRTQDVILSSLALVVLSPVMLATAIAIVVDDPSAGPVFSQERIGRNGKPFKFYKFRSMCPNAEAKLDDLLDQNEMDGPVFKIKDDPRITRVGKFIRKTSLDELPQLWNILKGDMSIVGPRPALPHEVEQYGDYEKQRLYVTPGLSCYWQIAPHRNDLSFEEWMDLDVKYVKERSFWVDWKIIFKTFKVCLLGRGE